MIYVVPPVVFVSASSLNCSPVLSIAAPIPRPTITVLIPISAIPHTAVCTASALESASERFVAKIN